MRIENPLCLRCKVRLYSIYTRKKNTFKCLRRNYYCNKCKCLYAVNLIKMNKKELKDFK